MTIITNWMRMLLVGLALATFAPTTTANAAPTVQTVATTRTELAEPAKQQAGSPEMGVLIVIGVVGFLVFVAWIVSRVGDDTRSSGDRTLI